MGTVKRPPGPATLVLIGFAIGSVCGLFLGELAVLLSTVGQARVQMML